MEAYETFEVNGLKVSIVQDDETESGNPRDADNVGIMISFHTRYTLGDSGRYIKEYDEARKAIKNARNEGENITEMLKRDFGATVVLPLFLLDHSGLAMRTSTFPEDSDGWDTSHVGYIFDTKYQRELVGAPEDSIESQLVSEVKQYDAYLQGSVFGYTVEKSETCSLGHTHREVIDSCWGYLVVDDSDMEYLRGEARSSAEYYANEASNG